MPFDSGAWSWGDVEHRSTIHLGRNCVVAADSAAVLMDASLLEGAIEVELSVGRERAFHGLVWRARDEENYESFFVRPHQVGNPDAVQYTPVFNGISAWQLYHGAGFWAPIAQSSRVRRRHLPLATIASSEASAGTTRSISRSRTARTNLPSRCRRISAAGVCRRGRAAQRSL